jgi:trehalose-phosphatase
MILCTADQVLEQLTQAERLWAFLDYDGTLADFAPTPEHVTPDPAVIDLITLLAQHSRIRVAVISGRRLSHVEALLPVPGILLAGTYGVELKTPEGERIGRAGFETIRPSLEKLRPRWLHLIEGRQGFFLEDKSWALALHARFAAEDEAEKVLSAAHGLAAETVLDESFRLLGGHRFLEIGPQLAHKGKTVAYLLNRYPWPNSLPLYVGDDDKDEEAFGVVRAHGGIAVLVAPVARRTKATCRLDSPQAARQWLGKLAQLVDQEVPP